MGDARNVRQIVYRVKVIQNAPSVYLVLRDLIVKNIVTQAVSMVCAKLMELVHMDATILCMVLDAKPHV